MISWELDYFFIIFYRFIFNEPIIESHRLSTFKKIFFSEGIITIFFNLFYLLLLFIFSTI